MQRSLFDNVTVKTVIERLGRLTSDSTPRWGRMSAGAMLCHLNDYFDVALGRTAASPAVPPSLQPLVRFVLVRWPGRYPRNARTLPELLVTRPTDFDEDRRRLMSNIEEFAARRSRTDWPRSPIAGRMKGKQWARLAHDHVEHHLQQFGL